MGQLAFRREARQNEAVVSHDDDSTVRYAALLNYYLFKFSNRALNRHADTCLKWREVNATQACDGLPDTWICVLNQNVANSYTVFYIVVKPEKVYAK